MKKTMLSVIMFFCVVGFGTGFVFVQSSAQACINDDMNTKKEGMNRCTLLLLSSALFLGVSSASAAILGVVLFNQPSTGQSAKVSAHYDPGGQKLVLQFDRPVVAQNPQNQQRMALLYYHAGGMAAAVPGRQCGNRGLTLAFTTDMKETPTRMELVVCPGAMYPAGFPESDVCADGRPIRVDVDILICDT